MGFSFVEIESQKSRYIALLFAMLIVFYFLIAWLVVIPVKITGFMSTSDSMLRGITALAFFPTVAESLVALAIAAVAGIIHWSLSIHGMTDRVLGALGAIELDADDVFHQQFKNIVEEASIAAGGARIECRVLPSTAVNAFALEDFSGRKVVGVTEGLLARLNREQLEGVIGHEVAHLVSGDSLTASVAMSLFGVYSGIMQGIERLLSGESKPRRNSAGRGAGGFVALLIMVYIILAFSNLLNALLSTLISRQREYRADAVGVRLTRNPLAMAQALHIIARGWRGAFLPLKNMATIFIVNPAYRVLDEQSGFWADLFSTHPPVRQRISVLLDMAHSSTDDLAATIVRQEQARLTRRDTAVVLNKTPRRWFVAGPNSQWQGPFDLQQLPHLGWLTAQTWVRVEGQTRIQYAWEETDINSVLQGVVPQKAAAHCPHCRQTLSAMQYEGLVLQLCMNCEGYMVARPQISRILARQQQFIAPAVERLGQVIQQACRSPQSYGRPLTVHSEFALPCPACGKALQRSLYSAAYPVEIDLCGTCDIMWFDKNELELLQYLYEEYEPREKTVG